MKILSIVGVGLIAGSLSLALKKTGVFGAIRGVDKSEKALKEAYKNNIIDDYTTDLIKGTKNADMIILGAPVLQMEELLTKMSDNLKVDAVVLDVGSTKRNVCEIAYELLPDYVTFIGGHPMTGSELSGVKYADSELFVDRPFVLTPTKVYNSNHGRDDIDGRHGEKLAIVKKMLTQIGAKPVIMEPDEHDNIVASISHLPHFLAFCLVECVMLSENKDIKKELSAGGFRDTTRIAMGNPEMWSEIFLKNKDNLRKWVERFVKESDELLNIIETGNKGDIIKRLEIINKAREELK